jgi:hypothetical protein
VWEQLLTLVVFSVDQGVVDLVVFESERKKDRALR